MAESNDQQPYPACWKQPCNEEHLAKIATWITDWRAVSPFLEITEVEEIAILESTHSVPARKMAMLRKWKHKKGGKATYKRLCQAFRDCSFCDLKEKTIHLLTKHSSNNSSDEDEDVLPKLSGGEQLCNVNDDKKSRNEYYVSDNERLDQCVQDQKAQVATLEQELTEQKEKIVEQQEKIAVLEQENVAVTENFEKEKAKFCEALQSKEHELMIVHETMCEVMGNIKEPRDIPPKLSADDTIDKSVYTMLQRAYKDVEVRWKKGERVNIQLRDRVAELEKRLDKQQEVFNEKLTEVKGLQDQQKAMQTLIYTLNKENGQLKEQVLQIRAEYGSYRHRQLFHDALQKSPPEQEQTSVCVPHLRQESSKPTCPVCQVRFPHTLTQVDIERHVNAHFDC